MILEHKSKPIVLNAQPRAGSSYLHRMTRIQHFPHINWQRARFTLQDAVIRKQDNPNYKIVISVRNPLERFWSYFFCFRYKFVNWNLTNVKDFFNEFQITCHYDPHTTFQRYMLEYFHKVIDYADFIEMEDLPILVENKPKFTQHTDYTDQVTFPFDEDCRSYLTEKITDLYQTDINWYNSIKKMKLEVDNNG